LLGTYHSFIERRSDSSERCHHTTTELDPNNERSSPCRSGKGGASMSDTPEVGWWRAEDGRWYPPDAHPDHAAVAEDPEGGPAAAGWWRADDGNWYPPGRTPDMLPGGTVNDRPVPGEVIEPTAHDAPGAPATGDRRRLILIVGAVAAAALLVAAGLVLLRGGDDTPAGDDRAAPTGPATSEVPATALAPELTTTSTTVMVEPPPRVSGSGSAVVALERRTTEPYLALVTHDGPGGFGLAFLDDDGAVVEEPVSGATFGDYLGVHPVNFVAGESVASVRVDGEGPWAVSFALVESAPLLASTPGSTYEGRGDRVVKFSADDSAQVAVACSGCNSAVSVIAWSGTGAPGTPLTVENEEVTVPSGTRFLQVLAQGAAGVLPGWTLTSS
jgi:hypothetical protein